MPQARFDAEFVSGDFFRVLGVTPILGRDFTWTTNSDANQPIILSYAFWVTDFHSSPDIVGKQITSAIACDRSSAFCRRISVFLAIEAPAGFWGAFMQGSLSSANRERHAAEGFDQSDIATKRATRHR